MSSERASEGERRALHERFAALCRIPSPSGQEDAVAAHVAGLLGEMGVTARPDAFGNLLARIPAPPGAPTILLCAHMDTVPATGPIEPVEVDGGWENAREDILGADNKASVAVLLAIAARATRPSRPPVPVGLELLFTRQEENGLAGAKAFDVSTVESRLGFVFDNATPIGNVIVASPTYYRMEAVLRGQAAHAGIRPEEGRNAIVAAARAIAALRLGRLDDETTANVGTITGGTGGTNVVADRCSFLAEARSLDAGRVEALVAEMIDRIHEAANDPSCDVDADVTVERLFEGYRHRPSSPALAIAEQALRAAGHEPRRIATGGGSDVNALEASGLHCVNLANGTERNHEPTERVSFAALEGMLDVAYAVLDASASARY